MKRWNRLLHSPCLPLGEDGKTVTGCKEHIELSRKAATEGMVLLKNNGGVLPLKRGQKVAVFGKNQFSYFQGGGGSGEVNSKYSRCLFDGLKIKENEGKVVIYGGLRDFYANSIDKLEHQEGFNVLLGRPDFKDEPILNEELINNAKSFTDTAIIAIGRFSGEGWDRKGEKYDGDFYLDRNEEEMVNIVSENFNNVIVVINSGSQIDSEWFYNNDRISSVLYSWQAGMEGGLAIADILCGDVNPSGKLVDTFAKTFLDYPSANTFNESDDYVKYYEDIYVGYRYFETIPNMSNRVNYPFGFGLSYTDFKIDNIKAYKDYDKICIRTDVTNIGKVKGKEVVQVYFEAPQGVLGKPKYQLCAFLKTNELSPNEKCTLSMNFEINSMASYDDLGKIKESAYVLEKGSYKFYVGNSVRNTKKSDFEYVIENDIVVEQLSRRCAPKKLEKRLLANGQYEKMPSFESNIFKNKFPKNEAKPPEKIAKLIDVVDDNISVNEFLAQLSDDELIGILGGQSCTGVANTCGMGNLLKYGIPNLMTADGPAGLRIDRGIDVFTTAFPCATLLACTWSTEIMYEIGKAGAKEVKENNIGMWLTPALNIHRNPLCGRNFEYFSEDPLVSGKMAQASVKGIQSENISACAKHFCANNKEVNRMESDSILSERALREIYMKGFEICVKEASPWSIMTSYNYINGVRAGENYDAITNVLRGEWNYEGMVTTDWEAHSKQYKELKAGNDIKMPWGFVDSVKKAMEEEKITRAEIEACAKRFLNMLSKID